MTLIKHGRLSEKNLEQELLTIDELKSQLRQAGVHKIQEVKHAMLEPDGHISIIKYSDQELQRRDRGVPGAG